MRIGLDARTLYSRQPRGTGRNLRDVFRRMTRDNSRDSFFLYHRSAAGVGGAGILPAPEFNSLSATGDDWTAAPNVAARSIELAGDRFNLWMSLRLPLAAWHDRLDVLHAPANAAPALCLVPTVVTIHDLIPLEPSCADAPAEARAFERGIRRALRVASHIVTPSRYTRDQLVTRFSANAQRISVVPWAPDSRITQRLPDAERAAEHARVTALFDLSAPWILNFSGRSKRKNARALLAAFAELPPELRDSTLLMLIGCEPAAARSEMMDFARERGTGDRCRILGFQSEADAAALLRGAAGLAMPSLAEGFGLPILDAMACGVPVLASDCTSLPEVAGDAAVYVDPHSITSIRDGLLGLLAPESRAERIERGLDRAAQFTWERTASLLHAVYDRCARTRAAVRRKARAAALSGGAS